MSNEEYRRLGSPPSSTWPRRGVENELTGRRAFWVEKRADEASESSLLLLEYVRGAWDGGLGPSSDTGERAGEPGAVAGGVDRGECEGV